MMYKQSFRTLNQTLDQTLDQTLARSSRRRKHRRSTAVICASQANAVVIRSSSKDVCALKAKAA